MCDCFTTHTQTHTQRCKQRKHTHTHKERELERDTHTHTLLCNLPICLAAVMDSLGASIFDVQTYTRIISLCLSVIRPLN
jgi:hypothetical protein